MKSLITIDLGGTSIKYGLWNQKSKKLSQQGQVDTPKKLTDFYQIIEDIVSKFSDSNVEGIGFSFPGAVNSEKGVIEGISAVPYIHNFPIKKELEKRFKLPISMANDANCAAIAEITDGAAKDVKNVLFLVIGTGVGGAAVLNRHLIIGNHLYGGEFGMMLVKGKALSSVGTVVSLASKYNKLSHTNLSGKEVLDLAKKSEPSAKKLADEMFECLAQGIYNLQFTLDPEKFVIGGGVSKNSYFFDQLNSALKTLVKEINLIDYVPAVIPAHFYNDANLIGAAENFYFK
ncbi:ROK family protein [Xylocopilactobacillus apis]|uniref:N-acetylmannosamine kinase n=1 Tax=Xylocopilactobacillus apis TaxID=2932183 RepID=A0AAU9D3Q3_9LACO|nr:ROK family protein [Xylocopilactobacillus apis]BDR56960.1 N-acetylmannosamine kinase [Xylocopilactobacillus apis]